MYEPNPSWQSTPDLKRSISRLSGACYNVRDLEFTTSEAINLSILELEVIDE